jgi:hypothetical protein
MRRIPRPLLALVACAALCITSGRARAQTTTTTKATTTTTTTSTTTTTTLLPHPFSKATKNCIRKASADRRSCRRGHGTDCFGAFQKAYSSCFAAGAGVKCATKCTGNETTCYGKLPATKKTCRKACATGRHADVKACRLIAAGDNLWSGGDASCLTTSQSNFDLCRAVCAGLAADCRTALCFCIANCANL